MIGIRIQYARKAAGYSLESLGKTLGLSKMTVSKFERNIQTPSSQQLIALSKALNVRIDYFFRTQHIELGHIEYRKKSNTPKKLLDKIHNCIRDQAERWEILLNLYPKPPIKPFCLPKQLPKSIQNMDQIELIADTMRDYWQLGRNPIPDMIDTLETHGILVIVMHEDDAGKFDGLAGTVGDKPIISVSQHWSGDRQRFTLAHELGHLVLQGRLTDDLDEEKACNRFAGAFLLPQQAVHAHFAQHRTALESQELYLLKHEFGLSMAGCLFRLLQCDIINQSLFTHWQRLFSQYGWRKHEPGNPYPAEKTILFKQLVYQALAEEYVTESKAAELLGISVIAFHQQRKLEMPNADID